MNLKQKLATIVAVQHFLVDVTGEAHVTDEEFAKVSLAMYSQFNRVEENGKLDGESIVELCLGVLASLTGEVVAATEESE